MSHALQEAHRQRGKVELTKRGGLCCLMRHGDAGRRKQKTPKKKRRKPDTIELQNDEMHAKEGKEFELGDGLRSLATFRKAGFLHPANVVRVAPDANTTEGDAEGHVEPGNCKGVGTVNGAGEGRGSTATTRPSVVSIPPPLPQVAATEDAVHLGRGLRLQRSEANASAEEVGRHQGGGIVNERRVRITWDDPDDISGFFLDEPEPDTFGEMMEMSNAVFEENLEAERQQAGCGHTMCPGQPLPARCQWL
eukprot:TRINITY_DN53023_c0_g1_i1.p1 TRINITY_DN53023_c0_g1~~TRINITY_DN53023_c0_g1_i1.p1  ORF type:complete len:250 (-),score=54.33 TRINITY_DN53023_c0_g1_i1:11-760(-)